MCAYNEKPVCWFVYSFVCVCLCLSVCFAWRSLALIVLFGVAYFCWRCLSCLALFSAACLFRCFYLALLGFAGVACLAWHCLALLPFASRWLSCLASATGFAGSSCTLLAANELSVLLLAWWVGGVVLIKFPGGLAYAQLSGPGDLFSTGCNPTGIRNLTFPVFFFPTSVLAHILNVFLMHFGPFWDPFSTLFWIIWNLFWGLL